MKKSYKKPHTHVSMLMYVCMYSYYKKTWHYCASGDLNKKVIIHTPVCTHIQVSMTFLWGLSMCLFFVLF